MQACIVHQANSKTVNSVLKLHLYVSGKFKLKASVTSTSSEIQEKSGIYWFFHLEKFS